MPKNDKKNDKTVPSRESFGLPTRRRSTPMTPRERLSRRLQGGEGRTDPNAKPDKAEPGFDFFGRRGLKKAAEK